MPSESYEEAVTAILVHVLILVLMENALRASYTSKSKEDWEMCLNPCFNGKCPQRAENKSNYLSVT